MNDGGPAHAMGIPEGQHKGHGSYVQLGMSVRDYFAGQALTGIIAHPALHPDDASQVGSANLAYDFADAMLLARKE